MKTQRQLKGESILQKTITEIIGKSFGFVASVSSIELSPDFKYAKVYISKLNNDFDFDIFIRVIKSKIGKALDFGITPRLEFVLVDPMNEQRDL